MNVKSILAHTQNNIQKVAFEEPILIKILSIS